MWERKGGRGEGVVASPPFLSRSAGEEGGWGEGEGHQTHSVARSPDPIASIEENICSHPNAGSICYTECTNATMRRFIIAQALELACAGAKL